MTEGNFEQIRFQKANEYLKQKYSELENDYKTPDGKYSGACTSIAADMAKIILEEGGKPYLVSIRGKKVDSINTKPIAPARYEGRVVWGGHTVCGVDGIIYDPMIGDPVTEDSYIQTAFLEPVDAEVFVSSEDIEEFIH